MPRRKKTFTPIASERTTTEVWMLGPDGLKPVKPEQTSEPTEQRPLEEPTDYCPMCADRFADEMLQSVIGPDSMTKQVILGQRPEGDRMKVTSKIKVRAKQVVTRKYGEMEFDRPEDDIDLSEYLSECVEDRISGNFDRDDDIEEVIEYLDEKNKWVKLD